MCPRHPCFRLSTSSSSGEIAPHHQSTWGACTPLFQILASCCWFLGLIHHLRSLCACLGVWISGGCEAHFRGFWMNSMPFPWKSKEHTSPSDRVCDASPTHWTAGHQTPWQKLGSPVIQASGSLLGQLASLPFAACPRASGTLVTRAGLLCSFWGAPFIQDTPGVRAPFPHSCEYLGTPLTPESPCSLLSSRPQSGH